MAVVVLLSLLPDGGRGRGGVVVEERVLHFHLASLERRVVSQQQVQLWGKLSIYVFFSNSNYQDYV